MSFKISICIYFLSQMKVSELNQTTGTCAFILGFFFIFCLFFTVFFEKKNYDENIYTRLQGKAAWFFILFCTKLNSRLPLAMFKYKSLSNVRNCDIIFTYTFPKCYQFSIHTFLFICLLILKQSTKKS